MGFVEEVYAAAEQPGELQRFGDTVQFCSAGARVLLSPAGGYAGPGWWLVTVTNNSIGSSVKLMTTDSGKAAQAIGLV